MTANASQTEIAAATAYEGLHVPALFKQWPPILVRAVKLQPSDRVLDVACGTGVLARDIASRLDEGGHIAGVDASSGMLAVARQLAPDIDWHDGVAERLPFEDASFDVVVSQFGLMFFRDRLQAIREMLRVLTPGGRVAVAVWDSLDNSEAYPDEVELLEKLAGIQAADALRAPFVLGDKKQLVALFESSGVQNVTVTTHHGTARFPSIRTMVEADLRGWLPVMGVNLTEESIEQILADSEKVLGRYVTPNGTVEFDAPAHIVVGKNP